MRATLPLLALLLLAAPCALASPAGTDFDIDVRPGETPAYDGPVGYFTLEEVVPGERITWRLNVPELFVVGDVRVHGAFNVTRARQVVPMLEGTPDEYPLFYQYPNERIWEADGASQLFRVIGEGQDFTLRLGIAGPIEGRFSLVRDVTPPTFEAGPVTNLTHYSFEQKTTSSELALGDLRIREVGAADEVPNPTTLYHTKQTFPVQGLDPDTEYEARFVFTDWAGNVAEGQPYRLRTLPKPFAPTPLVTPLSPAPNATVNATDVVLEARIESPASPVAPDGVRLFFDKKEVSATMRFEGGVMRWVPTTALRPGVHSVGIEVVNEAGGEGVARWTFTVPGEVAPLPGDVETAQLREAPGAGLVPLLAALGLLALLRRR